MSLQQIQFIVILVSPEGKLLNSDFILLLIGYHKRPNELFNYSFVCVYFTDVLLFVLCYLCFYVMLFLLLATWL